MKRSELIRGVLTFADLVEGHGTTGNDADALKDAAKIIRDLQARLDMAERAIREAITLRPAQCEAAPASNYCLTHGTRIAHCNSDADVFVSLDNTLAAIKSEDWINE